MCKLLISWLCCCCPRKNSSSKNDKLNKRLGKRFNKSSTTARYGTNWESLVLTVEMSASQIDDSMISRDIEIDSKMFNSKEEVYKFILPDYDFVMNDSMKLGKGSFGEVYKIREKASGEWRAAKIMRLRNDNDITRRRFDAFKNEIFGLRKNPHKNIIELIDHSMVTNLFLSVLIMEYAEGGDLMKRLKTVNKTTKKGFPEVEAKPYFVQISNALNFVHLNGLIHGDLKLENVLICKTKEGKEVIKVSDFGCARVIHKDDKWTDKLRQAQGTIAYMAPEQLRVYIVVNLNRPDLVKRPTNSYNPFRADVWSLGVCLYRMLFFSHPYAFDHKNELKSITKMLENMHKKLDFSKCNVSNECLDLLTDIMEYNKTKRIDMETVMRHKWIINSPDLDKNPFSKIV